MSGRTGARRSTTAPRAARSSLRRASRRESRPSASAGSTGARRARRARRRFRRSSHPSRARSSTRARAIRAREPGAARASPSRTSTSARRDSDSKPPAGSSRRPTRGAPHRGSGETDPGRPEERDPPLRELGHERGLLPHRVADEDGDPVEGDAVVDRPEDLANDLARLGQLGRRDDDVRLGRLGLRARVQCGHAEKLREEGRADERDAVARLLGGPVPGDEGEDGSLPGDGGEERLADATQVVEAVDEERLGPRRFPHERGSLQGGVRIGEGSPEALEAAEHPCDLREERGAIAGARDLRGEVPEVRGGDARAAEVGGRPRNERRGRGAFAQDVEDLSFGRVEERPAREEHLAERRERRARVGLGIAVARQVEERDEAEVGDSAERLGGAPPQVDAEEVRADQDVDGAERVGRLERADLVQEPCLERGEVADEQGVAGSRRHPAECTGAEAGAEVSPLSSGGSGRLLSRAGRGSAA